MINKNRVVPITKTDLLTLIGTILALIGAAFTTLKSITVAGQFAVTDAGDAGTKLADQPVKTLDFDAGTTAGTVYFVAAYDFAGITVGGADPTWGAGSLTNADVAADAATL